MRMLRYIALLLVVLMYAQSDTSGRPPFQIYAYVPWKTNDKARKQITHLMQESGVLPIRVIYPEQIFDQGQLDIAKLKQLAIEAEQEASIPVSFDLELGNRFHPETVLPQIQTIASLFREIAPHVTFGFYGTLPQNTFAREDMHGYYDKLNEKYKSLINFVDFLSPVLYNYRGSDLQAWSKDAMYNMNVAKRYSAGKPILPYISPVINLQKTDWAKNGTLVEELNEEAMTQRLQILYDQGASGCIIWASSQDRTGKDKFPVFSQDQAWGRAVVTFIKNH